MTYLQPRTAAGLVVLASAAVLSSAYAFEHWGGLAPCILCWWQRYAHMGVIAIAMLALLPVGAGLRAVLLLGAAATALAGAGIAGFHVGVEQHWWQGTAECGSTLGPATSIEEMRQRLLAQPVVRCDEVAWSLFGISMAGYNVLISLALAALAAAAGWKGLGVNALMTSRA
ncbi:MAG TPA: disulfide bond formation protein B [Alphaproteobacteria bacterium]|nr:disulfide bond formation protein B [Alphaproteobacteria bacterium]